MLQIENKTSYKIAGSNLFLYNHIIRSVKGLWNTKVHSEILTEVFVFYIKENNVSIH